MQPLQLLKVRKPQIKLTESWGRNSIKVDRTSLNIRFENMDRHDNLKETQPHVEIGPGNHGRLNGKVYDLDDLREIQTCDGTAYVWTVRNLWNHRRRANAHFTVAFYHTGQFKRPIEQFAQTKRAVKFDRNLSCGDESRRVVSARDIATGLKCLAEQ